MFTAAGMVSISGHTSEAGRGQHPASERLLLAQGALKRIVRREPDVVLGTISYWLGELPVEDTTRVD